MHSYIGIAITNMNLLQKILPTVTAEAHCDIPCGIYDPTPAKIAAVTVLRMVLQLGEFKPPEDMEDSYALNEAVDEIARIFYEVKGAQEKYEAYKTLTAKMF